MYFSELIDVRMVVMTVLANVKLIHTEVYLTTVLFLWLYNPESHKNKTSFITHQNVRAFLTQ
jgi:hypothetical protein